MKELPLLSEEELNDLAVRIVRGEVYITNSEESLRLSFGHLFALMTETPEWIDSIGAVYEEMSKAGPRGINGYPFFFSMKCLHRDQVDTLRERVEAKQQALQSA